MGTTDIRTGSQAFRPRARLIRTLGRELISNEIIAIQELIKNAYDADASHVRITFEGPLEIGQGALVVADNGEGMTIDTLQNAWMEPATLSKVKRTHSRSGRRVTGEKGIGRFASARIARMLELRSVAHENGRRVLARFDWGAFDNENHYLDEISCEWIEDSPPLGTEAGTTLRLAGLHDDWARDNGARFRALRSELARLVSPISNADFGISIEVPAPFDEFSGEITPPAFLGSPRYWITGHVGKAGEVDAVYEGPDHEPQDVTERGQRPQIRLAGGRAPLCGPFSFEFRVWDRSKDDLVPLAQEFDSTLRDIRRDLDAASGIRIYRDGFRVLLPDNDWLRLDLRRVQNPTLRLSNNQVVGVVTISRDDNPFLTDQTNRQGIVDSPAFEDFKQAVRDVLSRLETRRDLVRRAVDDGPKQGMFARLNINELKSFVQDKYKHDRDLQRVVEDAERSLTQTVGDVQVVLARYRRLATLGQLVDGILHEGRTPVAAISNAVKFANQDISAIELGRGVEAGKDRVRKRLTTITQQVERLSDLFRRIAPFSGRKTGKPRKTTLERLLADTFMLLELNIQELGVQVELPSGETEVTVDASEMQSLFLNLLENALYWLERVPVDERKIVVQIHRLPSELQVIFADNGPGVDESIQDRIFDAYFSARSDGVGLGLALAGEIAMEYGGSLELLKDGPLDGAVFRVILRRRIGE